MRQAGRVTALGLTPRYHLVCFPARLGPFTPLAVVGVAQLRVEPHPRFVGLVAARSQVGGACLALTVIG